MSRLVKLCAGLMLVTSLSGCCLFHGMGCGGGYPGGYYGGGYYGGGGGCSTGACGAYAPGGYPSAGLYNPQMPATAYAPGYPQMAIAPIDTLAQ
ncbi:MAG: hypothetical protein KDA96_03080 [Planctomycetaceae bacterium]|nr:hypothetical protein [Planctomycetaceae bacterium]